MLVGERQRVHRLLPERQRGRLPARRRHRAAVRVRDGECLRHRLLRRFLRRWLDLYAELRRLPQRGRGSGRVMRRPGGPSLQRRAPVCGVYGLLQRLPQQLTPRETSSRRAPRASPILPRDVERLPARKARLHPRPRVRLARGPAGAHRRRDGRRAPQLLPRHARGARRAPRAAQAGVGRARRRSRSPRCRTSAGPRSAPAASRALRPARRAPRSRSSRGTLSADERVIPIQYEGLAGDVRVGDRILFDDGRLVLTVHSRREARRSRRGSTRAAGCATTSACTCRARRCASRALTEKDKEDLVFGLSSGVDYIAMSFVRRAEDLRTIREICNAWGAADAGHRQDRDPGRRGEPREHRRRERRGDGGARRPRRGVPAGARAGHPAADPRDGAPRAPARHRGDRDAPVDDEVDAADARRGERRGQRRLLGDRLPDAERRDGDRRPSARSRAR